MEEKALGRPLLLTKGVNFTKLAVDRVSGLDQRPYIMLFIGTGMSDAANSVLTQHFGVSYGKGHMRDI